MNKAETAEGYPLVFSSNRDKKARDWSITGTNVGDIGTDGKYHLNVVNSGKSLISATDYFSKAADYSSVTEDGRNCAKFQNGVSYNYTDFEFKPNTQYTVSFDAKSVLREGESAAVGAASCVFRFVYTDGTYSNLLILNGSKWSIRTLTSTAGKTVDHIRGAALEYRYWIYVDIDTFQLEEGITPTEVEPYREPITTEIMLDEPIGVVKSYNLFNKDTYSYTLGYFTDDGVFITQSSGGTAYIDEYIAVEPNTSYFIGRTGGSVGAYGGVYFFDEEKNWLSRQLQQHTIETLTSGYSITTPANCYYILVRVVVTSDYAYPFNADNFQITEGSTEKEYKTYYIPSEDTATYKSGVLPKLEVCEGTNIITVEATNEPTNMTIKY